MRLLVATGNPDKLREIRSLLGHLAVELLTLRDFQPVPEPEETGATFQDNARLKALYYDGAVAQPAAAVQCGPVVYTVAEDSGLAVDALGGDPGIHSARFPRPDATYPERFAELYRRLSSAPRPWSARFVCAVALVHAGRVLDETIGTIEGEIAPEPRGSRGFGYDPIFYYPPYGRTLAEVPEVDKMRVAHRGHAFRQLARQLEGSATNSELRTEHRT